MNQEETYRTLLWSALVISIVVFFVNPGTNSQRLFFSLFPTMILAGVIMVLEAYLRIQHNIDAVAKKVEDGIEARFKAQMEEMRVYFKENEDIMGFLETLVIYLENSKNNFVEASEKLEQKIDELHQQEERQGEAGQVFR